MATVLFEYKSGKIGSWNGKWSGEQNTYARTKQIKTSELVKLKELGIDITPGKENWFHYDFGDGWTCSVVMTVGKASDFKNIMKKSIGFMTYDWMIDSILKHGKIIYDK